MIKKEWSRKLQQLGITYDHRTAGVYAIKDGDEIIYIGSSGHLYERISRYHSPGHNKDQIKKKTDQGIQGWQIYQFCLDNPDFDFEILQIADGLTRKELGELEAEITKQYNPKFNFRAGNEATPRQRIIYKQRIAEYKRQNALAQDHTNYIETCRRKFGRRIKVIETGEEFECIKDAQRKYDDTTDTLTRVLTGKHETFNGWHWTYAHDPRTIEEIQSMYYPNRPKDYQKLINNIRKDKIKELEEQIKEQKRLMRKPVKDKVVVANIQVELTVEDEEAIAELVRSETINHLDLYAKVASKYPDKNEVEINQIVEDTLSGNVRRQYIKDKKKQRKADIIKQGREVIKNARNEIIQSQIDELNGQIQLIKNGQDEDDRYLPILEQIEYAEELQDKFINGHLEDGSGSIAYGRTCNVKAREEADNEH